MTSNFLLTGLPRSGTTWASRAIVSALNGRLVHEPFNWKRYPERVGYHMRYLTASSSDEGLDEIYSKALRPGITDLFHPNRRIIVKDVHICLAVEHLWANFKPRIIIMMRHPCALASSWRQLELEARSRIELLLSQEALLSTYLAPFVDHLTSREGYYFDIGAYWGASYFVLDGISKRHPDWLWSSHENLCVDSLNSYLKLLHDLGLSDDDVHIQRLKRYLTRHDRAGNAQGHPYSLTRKTSREPEKWREMLSSAEIDAVLRGAERFGMLQKLGDLLG
ncbi:MAG: hypothetical protein BMS9Abin02_0760 [Anaerolineae bacterium]|nr:MAG: hypothetical protein BMS9Abin02_0760 [Anaerolineae bacterium]